MGTGSMNEANWDFQSQEERIEADLAAIPVEKVSSSYVDSLLRRDFNADGHNIVHLGQFKNESSKKEAEMILMRMAQENHPDLLGTYSSFDPENGERFVHNIEGKYKMEINNLEVAGHITDLTNIIWSLSRLDVNRIEDQEKISQKLPHIFDLANKLSKYKVVATHQTRNPKNIAPIRIEQGLTASGITDYEGAGVYAGILGGFRNWGKSESTFTFLVSLADTFPIITDRQYPQAMVVVLGEGLDIHQGVVLPQLQRELSVGIMMNMI